MGRILRADPIGKCAAGKLNDIWFNGDKREDLGS